ncbi:bifunctional phosphoglucose/phosphomannose isomerase [Rubrivirga sp.]|uniref:bifunctional phosphoglucose/phosphomannose isomerase n=1 Tax=Rubrivirga sp. TaxID=1885344 RepID=UPI003B52AE34
MPDLYDPSLDPGDMRAAVRAFPDHLAEGWRRGESVDGVGLDAGSLDGIVLCGMGGSAIGGDLVRGIVEPTAPLPFVVNRGYTLPGWVGERTLVVASSYSGGTEETLSAFADAKERGARRLAITSGGRLAEIAQSDGLDVVTIPGGLQPRAALGYSLGVVLRLARTLGLATLSDAEFESALSAARDRAERHDRDADGNPARDLAASFEDALPVVYTGVGLLEPVGMRWRTQMHENAKHPAVGNVLPELDHNEIMGFESGPPALLDRMHVVALRDADDHTQVAKRFDATRDLVADGIAGWTELRSEGDSRLARALSLVQLGDAASFWLAVRKGVDPTPVETIQALKKTLA